MLSLSPRYDLVRFLLPQEVLPEPVRTKWHKILLEEPGVFVEPINFLNETIVGVSIPGISDVNVQQAQHSTNAIRRENASGNRLGRLNVEPKQDNTYVGSWNPLDRIDRQLKVSFRHVQSHYNYFMLLEALFYRICKPTMYEEGEDLFVDLLDEDGTSRARVTFYQCNLDGMDGIEFGFDKVDHQADTFSITYKFNNIDFDILNVPQT